MHRQESVSGYDSGDVDWRLWCRLCAKDDPQNNINIFFKEENLVSARAGNAYANGVNSSDLGLIDAVRKYFWVNITSTDELPKVLCTECFARVTSMVNFAEHVCKVQQMFWTLQNSPVNTKLYMQSLRIKYGLLDEESELVTKRQLPEVHYVEEKPLVDEFEETIFEESVSTNNPLEPTHISIKDDLDINNFESDTLFDDVDDESFTQTRFVRNNIKKRKQKKQEEKDTTSRKQRCRTTSKIKDKPNGIELDKGKENNVAAEIHNVEKHAASNKKYIESESDTERNDKHDKDFVPSNHIEEKKNDTDVIDSKPEVKIRKRAKKIKGVAACDLCKKVFQNHCKLRRHQETHDSNKHTCPECGLQLNTRATFKQHMVVHSAEVKYKCDFCGRGFKRIKTMQNHLILHTGLRPYLCEFCGRTFPTSVNCRTHKTLTHRKELAALEAFTGSKTKKYKNKQNAHVENSEISA